jgi:hypothetical protein
VAVHSTKQKEIQEFQQVNNLPASFQIVTVKAEFNREGNMNLM